MAEAFAACREDGRSRFTTLELSTALHRVPQFAPLSGRDGFDSGDWMQGRMQVWNGSPPHRPPTPCA